MDRINLLSQTDFPLSEKTLDVMQNQTLLVEKLSALGGTDYIISGCDVADDVATDGFIVIAGEPMPFVGGAVKDHIKIIETKEAVAAFGKNYIDAYVSRYATFTDDEALAFSDYSKVKSTKDLYETIQGIQGSPPGVSEDWFGLLDKIPANYMLCDGRALNKADYPILYDNIGTTHGSVGDLQFKLPDCGARFTAAYDSDNVDHDAIGKKGGATTVTLTQAQMPNLKFSVTADQDYGGNGSTLALGGGGSPDVSVDTNTIGQNDSVENRPQFITAAKIIKVKY